MNDIDKLIESVFDGPEGSIQGLDAPAMREAAFLSDLKADLKKLRDVPECQLTTEHLRRAVLNRPQPASAPSKSIWLWSPFAVAASVALTFVLLNNQPRSGSVQVASNSSGKAAVKSLAIERSEVPETTAMATQPDDVSVDDMIAAMDMSMEQPVASTAKRTRGHSTPVRRKLADSESTMSVASYSTKVEASVPAASNDGLKSLAKPVAAEEKQDSPRVEPIVVVNDTPNPVTGAAEAKEVSKPSDMVFGG